MTDNMGTAARLLGKLQQHGNVNIGSLILLGLATAGVVIIIMYIWRRGPFKVLAKPEPVSAILVSETRPKNSASPSVVSKGANPHMALALIRQRMMDTCFEDNLRKARKSLEDAVAAARPTSSSGGDGERSRRLEEDRRVLEADLREFAREYLRRDGAPQKWGEPLSLLDRSSGLVSRINLADKGLVVPRVGEVVELKPITEGATWRQFKVDSVGLGGFHANGAWYAFDAEGWRGPREGGG